MNKERKEKVIVLEQVLEQEEIDILLNSPMMKKESFAYKLLLFSGMRVGTANHMEKSWLKYGKIVIPKRQRCNCKYCQQQEQRKIDYHKKMRDKFKSKNNPSEKEIDNWEKHQRTWKKTKENFGYWTPKTKNAVRKILIHEEIEEMLQKFFSKYERVMDYIPSPASWRQIIRNHYEKHLKNKIIHYVCPHVLRASFATMYYNSTRCSELELLTVMGWSDLKTAGLYCKPEMQKTTRRDFTG